MNLAEHKDVLIESLINAGKLQRREFQKSVNYTVKGDQSNIVTEVDLKSEEIIINKIESSFNLHNILSEEVGFINKKSEYTWIIDPLDGTSNFAAGISWFGILVSLHHHRECILAGAYLPIQDVLYMAEKGKGTFRNDEKIKVSDLEMKNMLFSFAMDFTKSEDILKDGLDIYKFLVQNSRNVRTTNSILDFLFVAEGKYGGAINLFTKIWDISAPSLIIQEAGGIFKNLDGANLDLVIREELKDKNYPVLAANPKTFEKIGEYLKF